MIKVSNWKEKEMLVLKDGVQLKLVCLDCGKDNMGESGLGGKFVHCFICMRDLVPEECRTAPVKPEELPALRQEAF